MCDTEIKCKICGNEYRVDRYVKGDIRSIMEKENVCFQCAYWLEKIMLTDENTAIINGIRYTIEKENQIGQFRGFGGREFNIEFFDGRKVTTHNLWCQGKIPETFLNYPEMQNNARFVNKEDM